MILYFSGTGNSKLAAEKLASLIQERTHNIEQGPPPEIQNGELLIFVAPLYFWTLPDIVLSYLTQHRELNRKELHVVMTCGGALGAGASLINRQLRLIGFKKVYVYALVMSTNYIPLHYVEPPKKAAKSIQAALYKLPEIAAKIKQKNSAPTSPFLQLGLPIVRSMYNRARRTRHFFATHRCVSCGLCASNCPSHAIGLQNGYPKWVKPQCTLCLRCLHRCPAAAIEYGKSTVGKERYRPGNLCLIHP